MKYKIAFALIYTVSLLPLWVLYRLSDALYYIIYYIARYRRRLVRKNMTDSFPEKTATEIVSIEKKYYSWFCDYMVETLKLFSISENEMRRRMKFEGLEQINSDFDAGCSISMLLGHYCNWEWVSSLGMYVGDNHIPAQLYHPLESQIADKLFLYARGRFKAQSLEMKEAFQILLNWKRQGKQTITGYISDQVPGFSSMHYWPMFLNHDTPAYSGAERIARVLDTSVYYLDIKRPRRGYYVGHLVRICEDTKKVPKFGITERYYRLLEQSIKNNPQYWLWSHNRWKRTREEFNKVYSEEERKRILNKL